MERKFTKIEKGNSKENQKYSTICSPPQTYLSAYQQRKWLKGHGKNHCISFSDDALKKLRKYFDSLDSGGKGSLGIEELQDAFIAFGLCENRLQVEQLIKSVDEDGSGKIQFDQFLGIMLSGASSKDSNGLLFNFFKKLSSDSMDDHYNKDVSFRVNVSQYRRKQILESMMCSIKDKKQKGMKILQNFKNQVMNNVELKELLNQSKKSNIYIYGFQRDKNV